MLTSLANPRVKAAVRLRSRRQRRRQGRFLVEGRREIAAALDAGWLLEALFYCADLFREQGAENAEENRDEDALLQACAAHGVACTATGAAAFRKMAYREKPDGLLAVAAMPATTLAGLPPPGPKPTLYLVAVGIQKPGNLGAMLRSAAAAGAAGALVADSVVDVFNPNVVRASMGALFRVPVAIASGKAARRWLAAADIRLVAASPGAATRYDSASWRGNVAIAVGSEAAGLGADWLAGAEQVAIPMAAGADSLNAATAAAVLLFEARRQRVDPGSGPCPEGLAPAS